MKPHERIYIIPTLAGAVFAAVVFLIFAAGYFAEGFGGPPQVLVISLLVGGIVALIQSNDNLRGIEIVSCRSEPVAAGEDVLLQVAVTNTSGDERLGLRVRFRDGWKLKGVAKIPVLHARESRTVALRVPTSCRGGFSVPAIWVSSVAPMGLCFAWKIFSGCGHYHAFPRGRSWKAIPDESGGDGSAGRAGCEDVSEHRAYAPGDMPSRIDWRVFARTGRLAVKAFEGSGGKRALLRWEDTAFLEDPEERLEQLSFWVSDCVRGSRQFELSLGGGTFNERNLKGCRITLATFGGSA